MCNQRGFFFVLSKVLIHETVGIVFSPTLNVPAALFSLFLTNYHSIFPSTLDVPPRAGNVGAARAQSGPGDRGFSPRQEVPSLAYRQQSAFRPMSPGDASRQQRSASTAFVQRSQDARPLHDIGIASVDIQRDHAENMALALENNQRASQANYQALPPSPSVSASSLYQQTPLRDSAQTTSMNLGSRVGVAVPPTPYTTPPQVQQPQTPLSHLPRTLSTDRRGGASPASSSPATFGGAAYTPLGLTAATSPLATRKGRPSSGLLADAPSASRAGPGTGSEMQMQARRKSSMQRLREIAGM